MLSLAESTELLQETTEQLTAATVTPQAGLLLIDQWLEPLWAGENTQPIADALQHLKNLLSSPSVDADAVREAMSGLAEQTSMMGAV